MRASLLLSFLIPASCVGFSNDIPSPPQLISPMPGEIITTLNVPFQWQSDASPQGFTLYVDDGVRLQSKEYPGIDLSGEATVSVCQSCTWRVSADWSSLSVSSDTNSFIVDVPVLEATIEINNGADFANNATVAVEISDVSEDVAELILSENPDFVAAAWIPAEPGIQQFQLSHGDGPKQIFLGLRSVKGITSMEVISAAITLDTSPPVISAFEQPLPSSTSEPDWPTRIVATDDLSGIDSYAVTMDEVMPPTTFPFASGSLMLNLPATGSYTLYPWVRDQAGNVSGGPGLELTVNYDDATSSRTWYAHPDGLGTGSGLSPLNAASDLNTLIPMIAPGEQLHLVEGDYALTGQLVMNSNIELLGGYDERYFERDSSMHVTKIIGNAEDGVLVNFTSPSFDGLTLSNSFIGSDVSTVSLVFGIALFRNCIVEGPTSAINESVAIEINGSGIDMEDSSIFLGNAPSSYGIHVVTAGGGMFMSNTTISWGTSFDDVIGILARGTMNLSNSQILGGVANNVTGLRLVNHSGIINENTISIGEVQTFGEAFRVEDSDSTIQDNLAIDGGFSTTGSTQGISINSPTQSATIRRNTINGGTASVSVIGIDCFDCDGGATIERNTIYGGDSEDQTYGIRIMTGTPTVSENIVNAGTAAQATGLSVGVQIMPSADATISGNVISAGQASLTQGVQISGAAPVITNNTIEGGSGSLVPSGAIATSMSAHPVLRDNILFVDGGAGFGVIAANLAEPGEFEYSLIFTTTSGRHYNDNSTFRNLDASNTWNPGPPTLFGGGMAIGNVTGIDISDIFAAGYDMTDLTTWAFRPGGPADGSSSTGGFIGADINAVGPSGS